MLYLCTIEIMKHTASNNVEFLYVIVKHFYKNNNNDYEKKIKVFTNIDMIVT